MAEVFYSLPGVELPVQEVTRRLDTMWEGDSDTGTVSSFRAVQMNVILHFGFDVTVEDAKARFDTLIRFAQRYPTRIIVLCPTREEDCGMSAKLFSQCYIGETHREMCCCEALLLRFKPEDHGYLANQVSVWQESDLPVYHWFSGTRAHRIEKYYASLVATARRCVHDSNVDPEDLNRLSWPDPDAVYDLADARLLPVRQSIGQYLSGYSMEQLSQGLESVKISYCKAMVGEAKHLKAWVQECLSGGSDDRLEPEFSVVEMTCSGLKDGLAMEWTYSDERYLKWRKYIDGSRGEIEANLGKGLDRIPTQIKPLEPEHALAEALFF